MALTSTGVGWLLAYTGSHTGKWSQAPGEKGLRIPPGGQGAEAEPVSLSRARLQALPWDCPAPPLWGSEKP